MTIAELLEQIAAAAAEQEAKIAALEAEVQHPTGPEVQVKLDELAELAQVYMDTPNGQDQEEQAALAAFLETQAEPPSEPSEE